MKKILTKITASVLALTAIFSSTVPIKTYAEKTNVRRIDMQSYVEDWSNIKSTDYVPLWSTQLKDGTKQVINSVRFRDNTGGVVYCVDNGKLPPTELWIDDEEKDTRDKIQNDKIFDVIHNGYPKKRGADYGVTDTQLEWGTSVAIYLATGNLYDKNTGELRPEKFELSNFNNEIFPTYSERMYTKEQLKRKFGLQPDSNKIDTAFEEVINSPDYTGIENLNKVVNLFANIGHLKANAQMKNLLNEITTGLTAGVKMENAVYKQKLNELKTLTHQNIENLYQAGIQKEKEQADEMLELIKKLLKPSPDRANSNQKIDILTNNATFVTKGNKVVYGPIKLNVKNPNNVTVKMEITSSNARIINGSNLTITSLQNRNINDTDIYIESDKLTTDQKVDFKIYSQDILPDVLFKGHGGTNDPQNIDNKYQAMYIFDYNYENYTQINFKGVVPPPPPTPPYEEVVEIVKTDDKTGQGLKDAVIEIYKENDILLETLTTNENGLVRTKELKEGNYYYKEKTAPKGYVLNTKKYSFTVNKAKKNSLLSLPNTKRTVKVRLTKINEKDLSPLAKAIFEVRNTQNDLMFVGETNLTGNTSTFELAVGSYNVIETQAPVGFEKLTAPIKIVVNEDGTITGNLTIKNKPKSNIVILRKIDKETKEGLSGAVFELMKNNNVIGTYTTNTKGETPEINLQDGKYSFREKIAPLGYKKEDTVKVFEVLRDGTIKGDITMSNERQANKVVISKTELTTAQPVEGAVIEIKDKSGNVVAKGTTDKNGKTPEMLLKTGEYTFREIIAPDGYILSDKSFNFSIDKAGKITGSTSFTNEFKKTKVIIKKIDTNSRSGLKDAEIEVRDTKNNKLIGLYKTDSKGEIELNLPFGEYSYTESKAPEGYIKIDTIFNFKIDKKGQVTGDLELRNAPGKMTILKVDEQGRTLEGAKVEVRNSKGNVVFSGTSNSRGEIEVTNLGEGRYTFRETVAPKGYIMSDKEYSFTMSKDGKVSGDTRIVNRRTSVEIVKKDRDTNRILSDAYIGIYDDDDKEVYRGRTDGNGRLYVPNLGEGKYYFKEISAPSGYELNKDSYRFTIDRDGRVNGDLTLYNRKIEITPNRPNEPYNPPSDPYRPYTPITPNVPTPNNPIIYDNPPRPDEPPRVPQNPENPLIDSPQDGVPTGPHNPQPKTPKQEIVKTSDNSVKNNYGALGSILALAVLFVGYNIIKNKKED